MTPREARKAIRAGYAQRLMRDWLEPDDQYGNTEPIFVLAPASIGHEGRDAPEVGGSTIFGWSRGRCTLLSREGLCEIHDSGFKPKQCRVSLGCTPVAEFPDGYEMARLWDTKAGKAVLDMWKKAVA